MVLRPRPRPAGANGRIYALWAVTWPGGANVGKNWGGCSGVWNGCFVALSLLEPLQISLLAPAGGDVQLEELQHARRQGESGCLRGFFVVFSVLLPLPGRLGHVTTFHARAGRG